MEQQTQWTRPGYRPNYNGGTPPPQMGTMNRPFARAAARRMRSASRRSFPALSAWKLSGLRSSPGLTQTPIRW